jgi:uncharacterized protein (TIGR00375 family)
LPYAYILFVVKIIADLHIHSPFSRASSKRLTLPNLDRWAAIKGIGLLGTGDCTHPLWLDQIRRETDDAEEGFYTLKKSPKKASSEKTRFVLTGEIATIYKKDRKLRKIHHVVILPDFKAARAFNARIEEAGANITGDGRPVLGMDSRDLLALLLEVNDKAMLIPAHIWTPWFSVLGSKSGFDSIEECYRDLAAHIPAVETGLSSNPPMNWAVKSLDNYSIVSNSDAHSPEKLGREATILDIDLSYSSLRSALFPKPFKAFPKILGTIEFFPQEGKYHYDGHRNCGVCLEPKKAAACNYICPACGKKMTRGVMSRVMELSGREVNENEPCPAQTEDTNRRSYYSLIPLTEIIAFILGTGSLSKKVLSAYFALVEKGGNEFSILMDMEKDELEKIGVFNLSGELLAGAIMKVRSGEVAISSGYDGKYGRILPDTGR